MCAVLGWKARVCVCVCVCVCAVSIPWSGQALLCVCVCVCVCAVSIPWSGQAPFVLPHTCLCMQSAYLGLNKLPLCYLIPVCVCSQHTLGWTSSPCVTSYLFVYAVSRPQAVYVPLVHSVTSCLFVCAANTSEQFDMATSSFQQSSVTTFYLCKSEQKLQFNKSRTTLFTNDVKLQAFGLKNGSFSGDGRFPAWIRLALLQWPQLVWWPLPQVAPLLLADT